MRNTSKEVAAALVEFEVRFGQMIDILAFDNRRIHALAISVRLFTGVRARPLHLWRHFSRAVACAAFKAKGRSGYSRLCRDASSRLESELGRKPQPCEVFIRIYDESVGVLLGRDAKDTARHNATY